MWTVGTPPVIRLENHHLGESACPMLPTIPDNALDAMPVTLQPPSLHPTISAHRQAGSTLIGVRECLMVWGRQG